MIALIAFAQEGEASARELPLPALGYGLLALSALMALLFVTWAFRSVGSRH